MINRIKFILNIRVLIIHLYDAIFIVQNSTLMICLMKIGKRSVIDIINYHFPTSLSKLRKSQNYTGENKYHPLT